MIIIENIKTYQPESSKHYEYVGRRNVSYNLRASPLANPFKISKIVTRDNSINLYEKYIEEELKDSDSEVSKEIDRLVEISKEKEVVFLCWCDPKPCHAQIIKKIVERKKNER